MEEDRLKLGKSIQTNTGFYQYICLYESGNKVVNDFIRYTQINSNLKID